MSFLVKEFFQEKTRAIFSYKKYNKYFGQTVLDVGAGGSPAFFRPLLGDRYKAVDVSDNRHKPDYFVDLEKGTLPFKDGEFETVLCFDNLEHCENCHELFDELIRVSSKHVIIALPNNWPPAVRNFLQGRNITHTFAYGLPAEKPDPGVRHKWYFNLEEAENFLVHRAKKKNGKVRELDYIFHAGFNIIKFPILYPMLFQASRQHLERFYNLDAADQAKFGSKGLMVQKMIKTLGLPMANSLLQIAKILSWPFWILDELIKQSIWGWGSKYRYLNMFCRQIWIVIEK
ncbi:MAG: class I SAM-dependent methyltransferase [Pseudobdellovibrionaceae bacterium]